MSDSELLDILESAVCETRENQNEEEELLEILESADHELYKRQLGQIENSLESLDFVGIMNSVMGQISGAGIGMSNEQTERLQKSLGGTMHVLKSTMASLGNNANAYYQLMELDKEKNEIERKVANLVVSMIEEDDGEERAPFSERKPQETLALMIELPFLDTKKAEVEASEEYQAYQRRLAEINAQGAELIKNLTGDSLHALREEMGLAQGGQIGEQFGGQNNAQNNGQNNAQNGQNGEIELIPHPAPLASSCVLC